MRLGLAILTTFILVFAYACEPAGSGDEVVANDESTEISGSLAVDENALASAYPEGLNVTAFSNDTSNSDILSSTGSLSIDYGTSLAMMSEPENSGMNLTEEMMQCAESVTAFDEGSATKPSLESGSVFADPADNKSARQKNIDASKRLKGEGDCLDADLTKTINRLLKHSVQVNLDGTACYRPDWGILAKNYDNSSEVCMVGFTRNEISKLAAYVDFSQLLVQGMICQAKKDGLVAEGASLEAGTSFNMLESLKGVLPSQSNVTITAASIGRATDNGDRPVYSSTVTVSVNGPNKDGTSTTFDMEIRTTHSPSASGNSEYDGVIAIEHPMPQHALGPDVTSSMDRALSLVYSRSNETIGGKTAARIQYEFRGGEFKSGLEVFDSSDVVNFNAHSDFTTYSVGNNGYGTWSNAATTLALTTEIRMCQPGENPANDNCKNPCMEGQNPETHNCILQNNNVNSTNTQQQNGGEHFDLGNENNYLQRMNRITYDGYPDLGVNKITYFVNFGGGYYESARGFVFDTKLVDGTLKGCGIAGASAPHGAGITDLYSIRRSVNEDYSLVAKGFWIPFLCDETKKGGTKVWRQCFEKNAEGNFIVDAAATEDDVTGFDFVDIGNVDTRITQAPPTSRFKEQKWGERQPPPPPTN